MLECDENVKEKRGKKHNRRSACRLPPCRSHMPHGHVAAVQQTTEASRAICMPWPWCQAKRMGLSPPRPFGAFGHLLTPFSACWQLCNRRRSDDPQPPSGQHTTPNTKRMQVPPFARIVQPHGCAHAACVALRRAPVSLPQKAEQPERQTGTRQEAHLHMQTTCQTSACKAAITAIKVFQATGTVAREGRHSARLSATIAGL